MKRLLLIYFVLFVINASAQKIMKLDTALKANSEMLVVKTKAAVVVGNILKYKFGPYEVVSTRAGWISSKNRKNFFDRVEKAKSKQQSSFVMLINDKDSITGSLSINTQADYLWERYLMVEKSSLSIKTEPELKSSTKNVIASISLPGDTTEWNIIYVSKLNPDSSSRVNKYGVITDGITSIEIGEVHQWENAKERVWQLTKGFEFYLNEEAIAAVQTPMDTFQKKYVWMKNGLDNKFRNLVAATAVILMGFNTDEQ
jgi:hypothetical protein